MFVSRVKTAKQVITFSQPGSAIDNQIIQQQTKPLSVS